MTLDTCLFWISTQFVMPKLSDMQHKFHWSGVLTRMAGMGHAPIAPDTTFARLWNSNMDQHKWPWLVYCSRNALSCFGQLQLAHFSNAGEPVLLCLVAACPAWQYGKKRK